jgi:hypothetical protein
VAKKKARTPPPPRPVQDAKGRAVQAPKVRSEPRVPRVGGDSSGRGRFWLIASIALVVVVVAIVLGVTLAGNSGADTGAITAAGCTTETFASQGRQHVEELEEGFAYNSVPATSGPHFAVPAIWNIYEEPVEEFRVVHNLEHGGIVVQYGDQVPPEAVEQIRAWYAAGDRSGLLVAPKPELGDKVALTAWTHLSTCAGFDQEAFDQFVENYRYQGPERFPVNAMQPGT